MAEKIKVPTLGESVTEATVSKWLKSKGETVSADEPIVELETDKVTIEVPSTINGVVSKIVVKEGETVELDAVLALLEEGAAAVENNEMSNIKTAEENIHEKPKNAPSAEKIMQEKNISPSSLKGSGRGGRIMKEDVINLPNNQNTLPNASTSMQSEEKVKMTRLRKTIARRLKESQNTAAMLTTYNEADMTAILKIRSEFKDQFFSKHGVKLGFMSFFVKACCKALEEVPEVNAQIDEDHIIYKHYVNMGVAVGTDNGLVVPVLKNADNMGFSDIEKEINKMGLRARDGKLSMDDMTGGTFTISNGGIYGSLMSSPILNSPESGILGMHKIQDRPMAIDGKIEIRPMMYLALSYDHRIVDGKGAVTFLVRVKENLEDPRRLLIDL